jgi:hypothetical protein
MLGPIKHSVGKFTAISYAARRCKLPNEIIRVDEPIEYRKFHNFKDITALMVAAGSGSLMAVSALLHAGADVRAGREEKYVLAYAAEGGKT